MSVQPKYSSTTSTVRHTTCYKHALRKHIALISGMIGANSPDKTGLVGTESALTRALTVVPGAAKIRQILPLTFRLIWCLRKKKGQPHEADMESGQTRKDIQLKRVCNPHPKRHNASLAL